MPVDQHPLYDTADCSEGQSGRVWFLGATFAPTVGGGGDILAYADRDCDVPAGVALFFPIINAEASTLEGNGTTEAELRDAARFFQDFAENLWCEVDGYVIRNLDGYRVQSQGELPEFNFFVDITYHLNVVARTNAGDVTMSPVLPGQETHWGLLKARYRP